jgi:predicted RNA-binding protein YlxR (DUF448 family)
VAPATELVRIVRIADGTLAIGTGLPGRGAWLCREVPECIELAERHRSFTRALRHPVEPEAVVRLRQALLGDRQL